MSRFYLKGSDGTEVHEAEVREADSRRPNGSLLELDSKEQEVAVLFFGKNTGLLERSGKLIPFYFCVRSKDIQLWIGGKTTRISASTEAPPKTPEFLSKNLSGEITSPMPGRVSKIHVHAGQQVQGSHPLLIVESMKMEITLSAPQAGRVQEIRCNAGDLVELGQVLVTLEPSDG